MSFNLRNQGYACRWYVFKYGKGSSLEDLKFKNLRDVEDFIHSDQPGASLHRRAIEKERRQTEAIVEKAHKKALKRNKREEREEHKKKKKKEKKSAKSSGGKGSRDPYYQKSKAHGEWGGSRKRHARGEETKKERKRRKKHEGSATKSGGRRRSRDYPDSESDDSDGAELEAEIKAKLEAKRECEARRHAHGKPPGSKNKKDVPKEQHLHGAVEGDGGGGAETSAGAGSSKDKEPGASLEGGDKQEGVEDNVEREIMEIVGAYSNPEARKELLAQLREHARQDARLQQKEKKEERGVVVTEPGDEPKTEKDADTEEADASGQQIDVADGEKTGQEPPAGASTGQAPQDTPSQEEQKETAVPEPGEESKTKKDADAELSGQHDDEAESEKTEKASPAEAPAQSAPQDADNHQGKEGTAVPEPGDEKQANMDGEEVEVLGQKSDVAGGDKTEKGEVHPAETTAGHEESPEVEGGQEDEVGHNRQEKGKKKEKAARTEQRRSPRTCGEGRAAGFFGGSSGGRSSPRLSGEGQAVSFPNSGGRSSPRLSGEGQAASVPNSGGRSSPRFSREGQAASFGGGGGSGTVVAGKKKRKADPLSSAGGGGSGKRQSFGVGREEDDNRRQSSRAASAAATAAIAGSS